MTKLSDSFDAGGYGVKCPRCNTVYFLEREINHDRMYYVAHGKTRLWKLLCICSNQFLFGKTKVEGFSTRKALFDGGYATKGFWEHSCLPSVVTGSDQLPPALEAFLRKRHQEKGGSKAALANLN